MAGRSFAALFQDSQGVDEEEDFFGDGSQVGNYSPPIRAAAAPFRAPAAGGFSPRVGALGAATGGLGALGAAEARCGLTFLDLPVCGGLNSRRGVSCLSDLSMFCSPRRPLPVDAAASMWWPRLDAVEVRVEAQVAEEPHPAPACLLVQQGFDEEENQPRNGVAPDLCDGTGEDDTCSPMGSANKRASSSSKRASSIGTTGESPSKKTKSPMVKALRGLVNEIKIAMEEGKKKEDNYAMREEARSRAMVNAQAHIMVQKRQAIQEEMDQCVALAKECGVAEASVEMWVASELFMDANKRAFSELCRLLKQGLRGSRCAANREEL
ncbi:hypothetical protein ZWY2020_044203 [Hordeum vulgare]|nr:hypothetical protein ZWY2020_044203 [Hordeum vulgare]